MQLILAGVSAGVPTAVACGLQTYRHVRRSCTEHTSQLIGAADMCWQLHAWGGITGTAHALRMALVLDTVLDKDCMSATAQTGTWGAWNHCHVLYLEPFKQLQ